MGYKFKQKGGILMNKKVWELVVKKYKTRNNIENFLVELAVNTTILVTFIILIYVVYRLI